MLRITASPRFSLWINGRYVGLGPARCYPSQQLYDEWDITPYVQEGNNAFAVLVRKPGGVAGYSLLNRVGLYMEGDIWGCDGSYTPVITDASWKVREADWYVPTPYVISLPLGGQEHVDGQREPALWQTAEPGDEWTPAFCLGGAGTPPWK